MLPHILIVTAAPSVDVTSVIDIYLAEYHHPIFIKGENGRSSAKPYESWVDESSISDALLKEADSIVLNSVSDSIGQEIVKKFSKSVNLIIISNEITNGLITYCRQPPHRYCILPMNPTPEIDWTYIYQ